MDVVFDFFVVVCQSITCLGYKCFAVVIKLLRLVAVGTILIVFWYGGYVSPYVSVYCSLHIALMPACSRCCADFIANVYTLYTNSFVVREFN